MTPDRLPWPVAVRIQLALSLALWALIIAAALALSGCAYTPQPNDQLIEMTRVHLNTIGGMGLE
jgi:hypothetical protein